MARRIAADPSGTWRRLITDAAGHLLDYGRSTYRPPSDLREHATTEWISPTGRRFDKPDERHPPDRSIEPAPF